MPPTSNLQPPNQSLVNQQTQALLPKIQSLFEREFSKEDIVPLYATDTGSRSYGFAHLRSDFDVHFIFIQRDLWNYFTIGDLTPSRPTAEYQFLIPDVESREEQSSPGTTSSLPSRNNFENETEETTTTQVEINCIGWDLIQFLRLVQKNNPAALQCLRSDNICFSHPQFGRRFVQLCEETILKNLSARAYYQSVLNLCRNNMKKYFCRTKTPSERSTMRVKVYLYLVQFLFHAQALYQQHAENGATPVSALSPLYANVTMIGKKKGKQNMRTGQNNDISTPEASSLARSTALNKKEDSASTASSNCVQEVTECGARVKKSHEEYTSVREFLPPLQLADLLQNTPQQIPRKILNFIEELIRLKSEAGWRKEEDPQVTRSFQFEVYLMLMFRRLFASRAHILKRYSTPQDIDILLRKILKLSYMIE